MSYWIGDDMDTIEEEKEKVDDVSGKRDKALWDKYNDYIGEIENIHMTFDEFCEWQDELMDSG